MMEDSHEKAFLISHILYGEVTGHLVFTETVMLCFVHLFLFDNWKQTTEKRWKGWLGGIKYS